MEYFYPPKELLEDYIAEQENAKVYGLRNALCDMEKLDKSKGLIFPIGRNDGGELVYDDLASLPHMLISGMVGSGKSCFLNNLICSLVFNYTSDQVKFLLLNTKGTEFSLFKDLPHLLNGNTVDGASEGLNALSALCEQMENRYKAFAECDGFVTNIVAYNKTKSCEKDKFPYLVVFIDDVLQLLEEDKELTEKIIATIAQKSRSAGIQLIINCHDLSYLSGTIKANMPCRLAFKTLDEKQSIDLLGEGGAESLQGDGQALYKSSAMPSAVKCQTVWVGEKDINNLLTFVRQVDKEWKKLKIRLNRLVKELTTPPEERPTQAYIDALNYAVDCGVVSVRSIRIKFKLNYARACELVTKMVKDGFALSEQGATAKKVVLSKEDFNLTFGTCED